MIPLILTEYTASILIEIFGNPARLKNPHERFYE